MDTLLLISAKPQSSHPTPCSPALKDFAWSCCSTYHKGSPLSGFVDFTIPEYVENSKGEKKARKFGAIKFRN
jgi:hypothetical protein